MSEKPVFDFTRVSRVWAKKWRALMAKAMKANAILASVPKEGISGAEMLEVQFAKAEAMEDINAIEGERDLLICEVLVSVPESWLVEGAPKGLTWASPDCLDWLLESRYGELFECMNEARQEPKN